MPDTSRFGAPERLPTPWRWAVEARNERRRRERARGWRVGKGPKDKRGFSPLDWLEGGLDLFDPLLLAVLALILAYLALFFVAWPLLALAAELAAGTPVRSPDADALTA